MAKRKTKGSLREIEEPGAGYEMQTNSGTEHARAAAVSKEEIAKRAYALFEARGREHGHDLDDWLQAERELGGI